MPFVRVIGLCKRCGYIASNDLCKACTLLEGLERGAPSLGIVRTYPVF
jgi:cytoplasmic tRNA 2-thiolation protein 1